ncbi:MAG: 4Fe-4S dicluster domain-containing protein [Candidatus Bathyarchaeota archaeon]|nr:4Fe-4S dicluster domain-containing protein [Candidatus Bathyarchaeota archaeon]
MLKNEKTQEKEMKKEMMLKVSDIDPKFKYEISKLPGAENVLLCFQCGTCTADCPIARFDDFYRPRKLVRLVQLGLKDKLLSNDVIWLCSTCFTCIDHCPQDVGIADIVRALRNLTTREGKMPVVYKEIASNILKTGYAYVIPGLRLKKREEEGLPSLPKASVENLAKLCDITGLSKMLEKVRT